MTWKSGNDGTNVGETMVPLSYFCSTLEMLLLNCEISLQLKWFANCFLITGIVANQEPKITITNTKLYVPVVTSQSYLKIMKI